MQRAKQNKKEREFVIVNQKAQFFKGFAKGLMIFTDHFNEAKPLMNIECLPTVKRAFPKDRIEILYID